jgi:hypothetical protein
MTIDPIPSLPILDSTISHPVTVPAAPAKVEAPTFQDQVNLASQDPVLAGFDVGAATAQAVRTEARDLLAATAPAAPTDAAADARVAYPAAAESLTSEILATDAENALLLQTVNTTIVPPGALEASLALAGTTPGTVTTILAGGLTGYWPGPTPEFLEALAEIEQAKDKPTTVHEAGATAKVQDRPRNAGDGEAAMEAYHQQESLTAEHEPQQHINLLD